MTKRNPAEQTVTRALDAMASHLDKAVAAIEAADPQQAFEAATILQQRFAAWRTQVEPDLRQLRARQAVRIREAGKLTIAALAQRISMRPARAHQLVKYAGRKSKED